jgi:hypothetical protein
VYAVREGGNGTPGTSITPEVYVNLFLPNTSTLSVGGKKLTLSQQTNYPWDGDIAISVDKSSAGLFAMKIRIPGWLRGNVVPSDLYTYTDNKRLSFTVTLNGKPISKAQYGRGAQDATDLSALIADDGYLTVTRRWEKGDRLQLHFDMEPRTVRANYKVEADRGMVAIERGPIVYCAEHADNQFDIFSTLVNQEPTFRLGQGEVDGTPVVTLTTSAQTLDFNKQGRLVTSDQTLTLIPYYAWCHRGSGKMRVWLAQDLTATTPAQPATLASESKVTASVAKMPAISAVNDRLVPKGENDRSVPYTHWWPKKASTEWIAYSFPQEEKVSTATVYWFSDKPWGGCAVPKAWRILYQDAEDQWKPVDNASGYTTSPGVANTVRFSPVSTKAVRLEVTLPDNDSAGLFEWSVK